MKAARQNFKKFTKEEIERHLTPAGGYLRKDLEAMGVKWPPMKGWKRRLIEGKDPNQGRRLSKQQLAAKREARKQARLTREKTQAIKAQEREWEREARERLDGF
jgi:hypothetical protein